MENGQDIRSEKTIVIGFTGPIGSGCTELSRFLSKNEELQKFLVESSYIHRKSDTKLKDNLFDADIKEEFKKKSEIEKSIDRLQCEAFDQNNVKSIPELNLKKDEAKVSHKKVRKHLEKRNYLYSFGYLLDSSYYKNKLRISCSSIIVFELVRNLDSPIKGGPEEQVNNFKKLIKQILASYSIDKNFAPKVFSCLEDLFIHGKKMEEIDVRLVPNCFEYIAKIKKDLKQNTLYRVLMQDFGDNLRSTGNPYHYPDPEWINKNKNDFQSNNYVIGKYIDYLIHYYSLANNTRLFVIDSLRNPMCVKYLRHRYSKFFLISIFASLKKREERIEKIDSNFDEKNFRQQDQRDQGKDFRYIYDSFYKQNVRESVLISDIAINNEDKFSYDLSNVVAKPQSEIFHKLLRYVALIINPGCTKPTIEEMFMNTAYTVALKSNCISRKVGAVIEGKHGYLVGAGWNDVGEGQISCGLRKIKDLRLPEYNYCIEAFKKKGGNEELSETEIIINLIKTYGDENCCFCLKDEISRIELQSKLGDIYGVYLTNGNTDGKKLYNKLHNDLKVKRLEFCKALHAEENAIIQGSKIGGMGLEDSKIYITTYPCELCAKKIQQAGIREIIYVEPYPKVLSEGLYLKDGVRKVKICQFEGVKAYSYMRLFKSLLDQKERQALEREGFYKNVV